MPTLQILVLSNGEVAETGSHHQLLERGGVYAGMWRLQGQGERAGGGRQEGSQEKVGREGLRGRNMGKGWTRGGGGRRGRWE